MNVNQYIFQSPSSSPVQVGRLDPSSKSEGTSSTGSNLPSATATLEKAQSFEATQKSEVKATVDATQLLDVYA